MKDYNIKLKIEINHGVLIEDIVYVYQRALSKVSPSFIHSSNYGRGFNFNKGAMIYDLFNRLDKEKGITVPVRLLEIMYDDFEKSSLGEEILPYVRKMTLYTKLGQALRECNAY